MRRRRLAVLAVLLGAALVLPLANPSGGYREYGVDAVNVGSGQVSRYWLALDQGMVMAALGNELTGDRLQRHLTRGAVERAVRPLLAMEEFTAGG